VPTPTATERALTAPLPTATSISIPTVLPAGGGCDPNVPNICIPPGLEPQDGDEGGVDIDSDFDAYPVLPDPGSGDSEPTMVAALPRPSPTVVSPLSTPTIVAPTPHLTMTSAPVPDRDCVDFTSQKEAQAFFEATGGPEVDIHRLDTDGDGIACSAVP
jgi:hypothetical protein